MREIKFRAWDTVTKKWLWPYPDGFHLFGEVTCFDCVAQELMKDNPEKKNSLERMNDVEIGQYTGLKDKNGKEIYEGDICFYPEFSNLAKSVYGKNCLIEWAEHYGRFQYKTFLGGMEYAMPTEQTLGINGIGFLENKSGKELEIIGNIYETPDLIK